MRYIIHQDMTHEGAVLLDTKYHTLKGQYFQRIAVLSNKQLDKIVERFILPNIQNGEFIMPRKNKRETPEGNNG